MAEMRAETKRGVIRWTVKTVVFLLLVAIAIVWSAGKWTWGMGWGYFLVMTINQAAIGALLFRRNPELLAERSKGQEGMKGWDIPLAIMVGTVLPLIVLIVAGLDERYGWTDPFPPWAQWVGLAAYTGSTVFADWAMLTNSYFSGVVRIQADRGQQVVETGPYAIVRHPGYLAGLIFHLFAPVGLNSLWAYVPVVVYVGVLILRTAMEDRTLHEELPGYAEYAEKMRYRLVPWVW